MMKLFRHKPSCNNKSTHHSILKSILCFFLALLMFSPVSAISEETLDFFDANGIYNYDPTGTNNNCYPGDVVISGTEAAEKIWSGLVTFMTEEQAAGVMGNMVVESGFNPVKHEYTQKDIYWGSPGFDLTSTIYYNGEKVSYGVGLIQWSGGRRPNVLGYIQSQAPNLLDYFMHPEEYNGSGDEFLAKVGDTIFNQLVQLELEFLESELNNYSSYKGIFETTSVAEAAEFFLYNIEVPSDPDGSRATRVENAQKYYDLFHGTTSFAGGSSGDNNNITGDNITIIGDSLTVGATSDLETKLPGVEINAEVGRSFSTGIQIATEMKHNNTLRKVVVFALGTNDSGLSSNIIEQAIEAIGTDKKIYFVTNYSTFDNGHDYTTNNTRFANAAQKYNNVGVIDWAKAVSANPSEYIPDTNLGVHLNSAGNALFADMIYNATTSNNVTADGCSRYGLRSGGLTYEEAYELVKLYVDNPDECYQYSDMCNIYSVEVGGNCSTFSSYFLGKYTTLGKVGLPNGRNVVNTLANKGLVTGSEPRPYAIFSTDSGTTICSDGRKCGHTGVILGINEAADEIYIGQMGYEAPRSWGLTAIRRKLSTYRNGSYTYAYTDDVLKGDI